MRCGPILLVLLLCGVAVILALRWHWRHEFHKRIDAIHAAGYPATPEEHDAWYPWPQSGDNAANWIVEAGAAHWEPPRADWLRLEEILWRQDADRPDLGRPLAEDLAALLEQYIRANSKPLESLYEAATIPECRYPIDLSAGPRAAMSHVGKVRTSVGLLCFQAVLYAEQEDPNAAVRAVRAAMRVADSLRNEPVMISHIIRLYGWAGICATIERVLNRVRCTDEQLQAMSDAFDELDVTTGLLRAWVGERCLMHPLFMRPQALGRDDFGKIPPGALLEAYGALGLSAREGIIYLDYAEECLRIVQLPVCQYRAACEAVDARHVRGRRGILLRRMTHGSGLFRSHVLYVARLQNAKISLALERYRLACGELPETLDRLVPEFLSAVPQDPFDGQPMRYNRQDGGYVVYSVGEDGRDDAGRVPPSKDARAGGDTSDLAFRVRR
ncbi:MAG TPA: hypothetical protein PKH24_13555 [Sedimentisphaerales bacterium]|jgi:hypothetical protein|nr:hypothetical protein [Sedimentisphaerales bacterium]HNU29889.1 hypothetical protein [Sedimentisphaerales bacterium]